jgi:para-aminobenzoate synthetase component 1
MPKNWTENWKEILLTLLPAGSISGTPKKKTIEIIKSIENYERGFYTGIFGIIDEKRGFLDSGVIIRYVENQNGQFIYKSGGGITFDSDVKSEYQELVDKVYI